MLYSYPSAWLADPRFIFGTMLWCIGVFINAHSDGILRALPPPPRPSPPAIPLRRFSKSLFSGGFSGELRDSRTADDTGYKIPRGGMFEYVSGANFFGEILEWIGAATNQIKPSATAGPFAGGGVFQRVFSSNADRVMLVFQGLPWLARHRPQWHSLRGSYYNGFISSIFQ